MNAATKAAILRGGLLAPKFATNSGGKIGELQGPERMSKAKTLHLLHAFA